MNPTRPTPYPLDLLHTHSTQFKLIRSVGQVGFESRRPPIYLNRSRWLTSTCYLLLTACYWLLATRYSLLTTYSILLHYSPLTTRYLLPTPYCSLPYCLLRVASGVLLPSRLLTLLHGERARVTKVAELRTGRICRRHSGKNSRYM